MCVIFLAHRAHPRYRLVVAANRDEFHTRATEAAHWWQDHPELLAGRDVLAGGTWMGITRSGRFAAITNFHDAPGLEGKWRTDFSPSGARSAPGEAGGHASERDGLKPVHSEPGTHNSPLVVHPEPGTRNPEPAGPVLPSELPTHNSELADPRSRGRLVLDFLLNVTTVTDNVTPVTFVDSIVPEQYSGFSLFVADGNELAFRSNRYDAPRRLPPGLYGLANGSLDSDELRVREIKTHVAELLGLGAPIEAASLFEALARPPLFIVRPIHGTRSSAVLLIEDSGEALFEERTFDPLGKPFGRVHHQFKVQP